MWFRNGVYAVCGTRHSVICGPLYQLLHNTRKIHCFLMETCCKHWREIPCSRCCRSSLL